MGWIWNKLQQNGWIEISNMIKWSLLRTSQETVMVELWLTLRTSFFIFIFRGQYFLNVNTIFFYNGEFSMMLMLAWKHAHHDKWGDHQYHHWDYDYLSDICWQTIWSKVSGRTEWWPEPKNNQHCTRCFEEQKQFTANQNDLLLFLQIWEDCVHQSHLGQEHQSVQR